MKQDLYVITSEELQKKCADVATSRKKLLNSIEKFITDAVGSKSTLFLNSPGFVNTNNSICGFQVEDTKSETVKKLTKVLCKHSGRRVFKNDSTAARELSKKYMQFYDEFTKHKGLSELRDLLKYNPSQTMVMNEEKGTVTFVSLAVSMYRQDKVGYTVFRGYEGYKPPRGVRLLKKAYPAEYTRLLELLNER